MPYFSLSSKRCCSCRFMSHVRHKIENEWEENDNVNDFNICSHCYRHYDSPFHLQCHIETVHTAVPAACMSFATCAVLKLSLPCRLNKHVDNRILFAATCMICELNFQSERTLLSHMKNLHSYNEMPYICKLCSYRSSFYSDLLSHFR